MIKRMKRVRVFALTSFGSDVLVPFIAILAGVLVYFFFGDRLILLLLQIADSLKIAPLTVSLTGCVIAFALLAVGSLFIAAPLLALISNIAFGAIVPAAVGFLLEGTDGYISFLHIALSLAVSFAFVFAFVAFTQIELRLCASLMSALRRDRRTCGGLIKILVCAVIVLAVLAALAFSICAIV